MQGIRAHILFKTGLVHIHKILGGIGARTCVIATAEIEIDIIDMFDLAKIQGRFCHINIGARLCPFAG